MTGMGRCAADPPHSPVIVKQAEESRHTCLSAFHALIPHLCSISEASLLSPFQRARQARFTLFQPPRDLEQVKDPWATRRYYVLVHSYMKMNTYIKNPNNHTHIKIHVLLVNSQGPKY